MVDFDIELETIKRSGLDFKFKLSRDVDRNLWILVSYVFQARRLVSVNYEHPTGNKGIAKELVIEYDPTMSRLEFLAAIDALDIRGIVHSYSERQIEGFFEKAYTLNKNHPLNTKGHRAPRRRKDDQD